MSVVVKTCSSENVFPPQTAVMLLLCPHSLKGLVPSQKTHHLNLNQAVRTQIQSYNDPVLCLCVGLTD